VADERNILRDEQPFDYKIIKGEKAQVFFEGRMIKVLIGKDYKKLIKCIDETDDYKIQLHLAKVTGNFKHGNEKRGK